MRDNAEGNGDTDSSEEGVVQRRCNCRRPHPQQHPLHFSWMYTGPIRSGGQTTNNCRHWRLPNQRQHVPTSVGVGSYAAIAYGKRWYVAEVTDVQDGVFGVSYMTPCRGKRKWDRTDEGEVEESDIIMTLSEPCAVGNLFHVKAEEKDVEDRLFSSISIDL